MRGRSGTLFYARNLRWTSQALVAATTERAAMGVRAWTALRHRDERVRKAFALWANSTLGALVHWTHGGKQQIGRSLIQVGALKAVPVPDLASLASESLENASQDFDRLAQRSLLPICQAHADYPRKLIDGAVLRLLGLTSRAIEGAAPGTAGAHDAPWRGIDDLRDAFCREPHIHGGSRSALERLAQAQPGAPA